MRLLVSGVLAAGLFTSQVANAQCVRAAENSALDVAGLKSQLMVTALTCGAEDRYNAFINKFRSELLSDEKEESGYFNRAYGRNSRTRHDSFTTQLANSRSESGLQHGNRFCDHNLGVFDEVMALRNGAELEQYASGRTTGNPVVAAACGSTPERPARATRAVAHTTKRAPVQRKS